MRYEFKLASRPFSINASTYSDARTKTSEVRDWAARIFHQLSSEENIQKMRNIRETFDEQKHSLAIECTAYYPREEFITKAQILSSKTIDTTNWEKLIVDLFFDKQYFNKPTPYGVQNINLNDKHIVEMWSRKKFHDSSDYLLEFTVSIIPRSF